MPVSARFLIDSSVFIRWMRQGRNPTAILRPYIAEGMVETCGVVMAEVLRGAKLPAIKKETYALFRALNSIDITVAIREETAELAWSLDRQGKVLQTTDLIIASCALAEKIPLVTFDKDFAVVPGLTVYPELP